MGVHLHVQTTMSLLMVVVSQSTAKFRDVFSMRASPVDLSIAAQLFQLVGMLVAHSAHIRDPQVDNAWCCILPQ